MKRLFLTWRQYPAALKRSVIGSALYALLFILMLPARRLTDLDLLYNLAVSLHLPASVSWLANLAENLALVGLAFLAAFAVIWLLWRKVQQWQGQTTRAVPGQSTRAGRLAAILRYALPCLLAWSLFLYAYWPGVLTSDSFDQWEQAHFTRPLSDWHPVGHTLYESLLTHLWDSPAAIAIFQVIALALVWGWAMQFLEAKGAKRPLLYLAILIFSLIPYNGILLVTLWKDVPYAIVNFLLVLLLIQVWWTRGQWLTTLSHALLLGLVIGLTYLFRHNGILILIAVPAALLILYGRKWKPVLFTVAAALVLVLLVRNGLAFGVFKASPNRESTQYEIPMHLISAVLHYGGQFTPEEQNFLERFAPVKIWQNAYVKYSADTMTKPWGAMHDPLVFDKIEQNKSQILQTFIHFSLRYPRTALTAELDLTSIVWEILEPPGYRDFMLNYVPASSDTKPITSPVFLHPHLNSPLKAFLDRYLQTTAESPLINWLIWRGGLSLFLILLFAGMLSIEKGWDALILFVPALANVLSLFLSMPGEDFRFIYPFVLPVFLYVLLLPLKREERVV